VKARRRQSERMTETAQAITHEATLWTEFVVAGERVYIRTRRPLQAPIEVSESAVENGAEPPEPHVGTVVPEAEP
jgi:hypothetical protein